MAQRGDHLAERVDRPGQIIVVEPGGTDKRKSDAIEIIDFDPIEDQLVLLWDLQDQPDPDVDIQPDPDNPDQSVLRVNGTEVLRINTSAALIASDITLLDNDSSPLLGLPFG